MAFFLYTFYRLSFGVSPDELNAKSDNSSPSAPCINEVAKLAAYSKQTLGSFAEF